MIIAVCSTVGKCLPVMEASVHAYAPEHTLLTLFPGGLMQQHGRTCGGSFTLVNDATNFGDAYNKLLTHIFKTTTEEGVIIANDDVVLTPDTMRLMLSDITCCKLLADSDRYHVGLIGARSDFVLPAQNIRVRAPSDDQLSWLRWPSEQWTKQATVIAPIFAYISREAFTAAQFPPINWYSDNVICEDLTRQGFRHFVSRAYVHHAGSQTVGMDAAKLTAEARVWIDEYRPEYARRWFP